MGFGRRYGKRNNGYDGYGKKRKLKTQIRLLGVLILIVGFLFSFYTIQNNNPNITILSIVLIIIGMGMILQKAGLKRLGKKITEPPPCNCCKCTNCSSNHNHWTHD